MKTTSLSVLVAVLISSSLSAQESREPPPEESGRSEREGAPGLSLQRGLARLMGRLDGRVTFCVPTRKRIVAITIDDGPDRSSTGPILDVLDRHGARATFFLIGNRIGGNEGIVRRMRRGGHEVGNHTLDGRPSIRVPPGELSRGIGETHELLRPLVGAVRWFRPGSGFYNRSILEAARTLGYRTALGDVFPYDTLVRDSSFHVDYILRHVRPGSIVVLHDGGGRGEKTAATLDRVVPVLKSRGYRFLTLTELVEQK